MKKDVYNCMYEWIFVNINCKFVDAICWRQCTEIIELFKT